MSSDTDTSNSYDPVETGEESVDLGDSGEEWGSEKAKLARTEMNHLLILAEKTQV